ncbi:MAG: hypothetical protein JWR39_1744 [Devosia sp.]|jgi:hypothetical protein|nr:hypothetical protein [Devosia sp.]
MISDGPSDLRVNVHAGVDFNDLGITAARLDQTAPDRAIAMAAAAPRRALANSMERARTQRNAGRGRRSTDLVPTLEALAR